MISWWNNNYLFRRAIQLSILDAIPVNHPVSFQISNSILLGLNKVRNDYKDLVVVYYNTLTNVWTPLSTESSNNNGIITIQFNTYAPVVATSISQYYLYYGNKLLTSAPSLPTFSFNQWPLNVNVDSNKITYQRPGEDWIDAQTGVIGAKAVFTFSGAAVQLIAMTGREYGAVSVQLDSNSQEMITCYRNGQAQPSIIYSSTTLAPGYHNLRMTNTALYNMTSDSNIFAINTINYLGYISASDMGEEIVSLNWSASTGGIS